MRALIPEQEPLLDALLPLCTHHAVLARFLCKQCGELVGWISEPAGMDGDVLRPLDCGAVVFLQDPSPQSGLMTIADEDGGEGFAVPVKSSLHDTFADVVTVTGKKARTAHYRVAFIEHPGGYRLPNELPMRCSRDSARDGLTLGSARSFAQRGRTEEITRRY